MVKGQPLKLANVKGRWKTPLDFFKNEALLLRVSARGRLGGYENWKPGPEAGAKGRGKKKAFGIRKGQEKRRGEGDSGKWPAKEGKRLLLIGGELGSCGGRQEEPDVSAIKETTDKSRCRERWGHLAAIPNRNRKRGKGGGRSISRLKLPEGGLGGTFPKIKERRQKMQGGKVVLR